MQKERFSLDNSTRHSFIQQMYLGLIAYSASEHRLWTRFWWVIMEDLGRGTGGGPLKTYSRSFWNSLSKRICACSIDHLPSMLKALSLFYPQGRETHGLQDSWVGKRSFHVSLVAEFDPLELRSRRRELTTSCPLTAMSPPTTWVTHPTPPQ